MEKNIAERKPSKFEIARIGKPLVSIAMEKIRQGNTLRGPRTKQVAVFIKDNRYIRLTDSYVERVGLVFVSAGDLSNGLIVETFNSYRGQVTQNELILGLPRDPQNNEFSHLRVGTSYSTLGLMAEITEELKTAQKVGLDEFDKALKTFNQASRRKNGRKL